MKLQKLFKTIFMHNINVFVSSSPKIYGLFQPTTFPKAFFLHSNVMQYYIIIYSVHFPVSFFRLFPSYCAIIYTHELHMLNSCTRFCQLFLFILALPRFHQMKIVCFIAIFRLCDIDILLIVFFPPHLRFSFSSFNLR